MRASCRSNRLRRKAFVDFGLIIEQGLVFVDDGTPGIQQDGEQTGGLFQIDEWSGTQFRRRDEPAQGSPLPPPGSQPGIQPRRPSADGSPCGRPLSEETFLMVVRRPYQMPADTDQENRTDAFRFKSRDGPSCRPQRDWPCWMSIITLSASSSSVTGVPSAKPDSLVPASESTSYVVVPSGVES